MAQDIRKMGTLRDADKNVIEAEIARAIAPFDRKAAVVHPLRQKLQNIMWDGVGVMRDKSSIEEALRQLDSLEAEFHEIGITSDMLAFNLTWHDWLNLGSLLDISKTITAAALARENSRGAHYREDFPDQGSLEESYFTRIQQKDGDLQVSRQPVDFTIVKPGDTILADDEPETLVAIK